MTKKVHEIDDQYEDRYRAQHGPEHDSSCIIPERRKTEDALLERCFDFDDLTDKFGVFLKQTKRLLEVNLAIRQLKK